MMHLKDKIWKRCYHKNSCPYPQVSSRVELAIQGGGVVARVDRSVLKFMKVSPVVKGEFTTNAPGSYVRRYAIQVVPVSRRGS